MIAGCLPLKRMSAAILLVATISCDRPPASSQAADAPLLPASNLAAEPLDHSETEALRAQLIEALRREIPGIHAAAFRRLRRGHEGTICGEVMLAQGAEPRAFLVTATGEAHISATPRIAYEDPFDSFAGLYARWCASLEELNAARSRLSNIEGLNEIAPSVDYESSIPDFADIPDYVTIPAEEILPPASLPPDGRWNAPGPAAAPPQNDSGRFADEVARPSNRTEPHR